LQTIGESGRYWSYHIHGKGLGRDGKFGGKGLMGICPGGGVIPISGSNNFLSLVVVVSIPTSLVVVVSITPQLDLMLPSLTIDLTGAVNGLEA
jgi:hypothetical protein